MGRGTCTPPCRPSTTGNPSGGATTLPNNFILSLKFDLVTE